MKLLYVTFIDFDRAASGSMVRPQKMRAAFEALGCEITLLQGMQNRRSERQARVKELMARLEEIKPDICYVEPPSGPFFNTVDLQLLKKLHKMGVPTGLFYRDMYWKFGLQQAGRGIVPWAKAQLISLMHLRDWKVFSDALKILYFPTVEMGQVLPTHCAIRALPPGCFIPPQEPAAPKTDDLPVGMYVGGIAELYGTEKMLLAAKEVNTPEVKFRLKLICREKEWAAFTQTHPEYTSLPWLKVLHIQGDELLRREYASADFALCPQQKTVYNDITMSVKFMEYISYGKPILATACKPLKDCIDRYKIGITTEDTAQAYAEGLRRMLADPAERRQWAQNCLKAREENLWTVRAQTVLDDLMALRKESK